LTRNEKWIMEHPDKETLIKEMDLQIRNLKGTLTKAYPKRVIELKHIKRKVRDLEEYMQYLLALLNANGIIYEERKPNLV